MKDENIKKLFKTLETEQKPPEGLEDRLLLNILGSGKGRPESFAMLHRVFFEKPLQAACTLSVIISLMLWGALGDRYLNVLMSITGTR
ncbi:MAG: hypothetical protein N2484_10915 [Clostridia bacterium]|nr:hypothetical protein [Clostridia bacterium]